MPARKKTVKKRTHKKSSKRSLLSLRKLLLIIIIFIGVVLVYFFINNPLSTQSISSERSVWAEEYLNVSGNQTQGGGVVPPNVAEASQFTPTVVNTGTWSGREIQVVKDAGFSTVFKSSVGILAINALPDGRLFMGGNAGFAIKYSEPEWRSVFEYKINNSGAGLIEAFVPTSGNPATQYPDVYMQTSRGVFRYTSQYGDSGNTSLVVDQTDSLGYLRNVNLVSYPDSNGVAAYKTNDLYFLESGSLRKWRTPLRQCGFQNLYDQIVSAYFDQNRNKTYFLMKECQTIYLYDLTLSSVQAQPLVAKRLARLDNFPQLNGLIQIEVGGKSSDLLYMTRIYTNKMYIIKDYNPNASQLSFTGVDTPNHTNAGTSSRVLYKTFDVEYDASDKIWSTQAIDTGSWWLSSDYASNLKYEFGNNTIANTYTNDITVDQDANMIYVSHEYVPNQFNSGLITIIGSAFSSPSTPTPTKKVAMCKAGLSYVVTRTACRPFKRGSTTGMSYGCSDGFVGTKTGACTTTAGWNAIAKNECSKRLTPCK